MTVRIEPWWIVAYLSLGVILFVPLNWLAHVRSQGRRGDFWMRLWRVSLRAKFVNVIVQIVAWPLTIWEEYR